jgi:hypothetical protein
MILLVVNSISVSCNENKKGNSQNFLENSLAVPGSRLELPSAAADMNSVNEVMSL